MAGVVIIALIVGAIVSIIVRQRCEEPFREDLQKYALINSNTNKKQKSKTNGFALSQKLADYITPLSKKEINDRRIILEQANLNITPQTWRAIEILSVMIGALLAGSFALLASLNFFIVLTLALVGAFLGLYGTKIFLKSKIKEYRKAVEKSLPNAIEMLSITVSSGLTIQEGIRTVSMQGDSIGAISNEFSKIIREIDYTGASFEQALTHMSERMKSQQISSFVSSIIQGSRGAGIKDTLKQQAQDSREILRDKIKEEIAKMGVKVTIPMTLFFLPSILVFVLLPTIMQIMSFIGGM